MIENHLVIPFPSPRPEIDEDDAFRDLRQQRDDDLSECLRDITRSLNRLGELPFFKIQAD